MDQTPEFIMCALWEPRHATHPQATFAFCGGCSGKVVISRGNLARAHAQGIQVMCNSCTRKAVAGGPTIVAGLKNGEVCGMDELAQHSETLKREIDANNN